MTNAELLTTLLLSLAAGCGAAETSGTAPESAPESATVSPSSAQPHEPETPTRSADTTSGMSSLPWNLVPVAGHVGYSRFDICVAEGSARYREGDSVWFRRDHERPIDCAQNPEVSLFVSRPPPTVEEWNAEGEQWRGENLHDVFDVATSDSDRRRRWRIFRGGQEGKTVYAERVILLADSSEEPYGVMCRARCSASMEDDHQAISLNLMRLCDHLLLAREAPRSVMRAGGRAL